MRLTNRAAPGASSVSASASPTASATEPNTSSAALPVSSAPPAEPPPSSPPPPQPTSANATATTVSQGRSVMNRRYRTPTSRYSRASTHASGPEHSPHDVVGEHGVGPELVRMSHRGVPGPTRDRRRLP